MFKVECPECAAPYQVDERRVPAAGVNMRCPKCRAAFVVHKPADVAADPRHESARPRSSSQDSTTMLGVAAPVQQKPAKPSVDRPAAAPPPPRRGAPAVKPPRPGGLRLKPPRPTGSSAAGDEDLPLPSQRSPQAKPSLSRPKPPPARPAQEQSVASVSFDDIDLESVPPSDEPGLPSIPPSDKPGLPSIPPSDRPGLPSVSPPERPGLPSALPAGGASLPSVAPEGTPSLPSRAPERAGSDPGAPSFDFSFGEDGPPVPVSSLPPALGGSGETRRVSVPHPGTVQRRSNEPAGLPPAQDPSHDSVIPLSNADLGSMRPSSESPEASSPADSSSGFSLDDDSLELPSPAADFEEELARRFEPEDPGDFRLPSSAPPSQRSTATRSPADEVESLAPDDVEIAEVQSFDPDSLPDLPDLDSGAPSRRPAAATVVDGPETGFSGEFEEEMFSLDSAPPSRAPAPQSEPDIDAVAQRSDAFDDFLDDSGSSGASVGGFSVPGASREQDEAALPFDDSPVDDDDFSSGSGQSGYGEVNLPSEEQGGAPGLDVGALDTDDEEFGGIPQEAPEAGAQELADMPPRPSATGSVPAATAEVSAKAVPAAPIKRASNAGKWAIASVLLLSMAGGALALLPNVGPFGAYFISDMLNAEQHQRLLSSTVEEVRTLRGKDSFSDVPSILRLAERAQSEAPRFKPLQAYDAYLRYSLVVRYGGQPQLQSAAKVRLGGLIEDGADASIGYFSLAQAAQGVVTGDDKGAARALSGAAGKDVEGQVLAAELALAMKQGAQAVKAWSGAVKAFPSAWTHHGLARAELLAEHFDKAKQSAEAALQINPEHVGAQLVLAQVSVQETDERAAVERLEKLLAAPANASPAQQVLAHSLLGELHLLRGRLSKAEAAFTAALEVESKALRATVGLGDTHYAAGRYSAALARYKVAADDESKPLSAQLGLIKAHIALERHQQARAVLKALQAEHGKNPEVLHWMGKLSASLGEAEKAEAAYRASIEAGRDSSVAVKSYVALAQLFSQDGKLDEAQTLLSEAQKKFPKSILLRNSLGQVAMSQGRYEAALLEFRAARKLDDDDVTSTFNEGSALRRLRRFDEAWKVFEQVAKLDKDLPGLPLERGLLLEQSGKTVEALKEYELALKKAPEDPDLKLRVGCGRVAVGKGKEAQEILDEVVKQRASISEVHHCLGRALFLQGRLMEALKRLQEALSLDPNRAEYHMFVGWVANDAGQVALAKRSLNTALSLDQGLADAYWQRGVLSLRQGGAGDAILDFNKALTLKPSRFEAHADLAQAYYQMGRLGQSLTHWQQALAQDAKNPTWLFRYGKLLYTQHRNADAAVQLEKAIALGAKEDSPPAWLWEAHHLAGASLGTGSRALEHWRKFLELGPKDSPYRKDAKRALAAAGQPWRRD